MLPGAHQFGYLLSMNDPEHKDPWVRRPKFRELVDRWLQNHPDRNRDDLAKLIGLSGWKSLKQYYSGKIKIPGRNLIESMIPVLGCQASDLMNDPGAKIAGKTTEGMSEKSRFLASLMFDKFMSSDLNDEDREILYQDWLQNHDRLRSHKARHERKNTP